MASSLYTSRGSIFRRTGQWQLLLHTTANTCPIVCRALTRMLISRVAAQMACSNACIQESLTRVTQREGG
eukprot:6180367-Pleurochrysis_carterae.AAC.4